MIKSLKFLSRSRRPRGAPGKQSGGARKGSASALPPRPDWQKTALVVVTIAILSVLMSVHLMPDKISLHLGEVSTREVRAPRSVIYVNSVSTAQAQEAARLASRPVYDADEHAPQVLASQG